MSLGPSKIENEMKILRPLFCYPNIPCIDVKLCNLHRTILQNKLRAEESRATLAVELRAVIERTPGLSCDGLGDEYLLEMLDWAARDRIDKVAGGPVTQDSSIGALQLIIYC